MKITDLRKLRMPIDEKCKGCMKTEIVDGHELCLAYIDPPLKWRFGECGLATHHGREIITEKEKYKPGKYGKKRRGK